MLDKLNNLCKVIILRLKRDNMGYGKKKYQFNFTDLIKKIFFKKIGKIKIDYVITGFPRSGTHWVRNVVETNSLKYCPNLEDMNLDKIINDKEVFLIKVHARSPIILKLKLFFQLPPNLFSGKVIYVYRDPRDSIISLYNMYNILKNKKLSQREFLDSYDPIGQYSWEIKEWVLNNKTTDILVIRFEDLKNKQVDTFNRIFKFLDINFKGDFQGMNTFVGVVENNTRPKGSVYGWKLSPEYKILIDEVNKRIPHIIMQLGYD